KLKRLDVIFGHYTEEKYKVLATIIKQPKEDLIKELLDSGIRGRGGAGFPTGLKWKFAASEKEAEKYVVCNADEGEPGTFKDREILTKVPRKVFSGMAACGYVIGAKKGYVYLRAEYRYLLPSLYEELDIYHEHTKKIGHDFTIDIKLGSGAYVCGEETALFESMEGKRGEPRNKPPFPTTSGYMGKPTVINNVETFASVVEIFRRGAAEYIKLGTTDSRGSKVFSVSGDTPIAGIYDLELGMTLESFVNEFGDGDTKAVQVGGAAGFCVPRKLFKDTIIGFEGVPTGGSMMLFNSSRSMYNVLKNYIEFFEEESCGQCTPCRVGCQQLHLGIEAVKKGEKPVSYLQELLKLTDTMKLASKCGLGQSVANSFSSIVENFKEEMIY
ncbi:MAG: NADH-ubiquinone oxidoreductase-F iron-sulfur binding region domain-containing protein, partial [Bacteroidales bacterium]|nr:NADH-ubiquinone oxidoreductase-F iron-sulfur binding region domain-containing protein [Bacteroidales bacterium]